MDTGVTQSRIRRSESTLTTALESALAESAGLLVCLDFDGTLTPIAETPTEPRITEANFHAIRTLSADPRARVAIISGRAIADLQPRVGIPDLVYAGNHGLEFARPGGTDIHPDAAKLEPAIQRVCSALNGQLAAVPGVIVENKGLTLTVHYRQVPEHRQSAVRRVVDAVTEPESDQLRVVPGKASIEIRPAVDWDKGDTVAALMAELPANWRTLYIGDDTTDEDAFAVLGPDDLDIFVGSGPTPASYQVADHREVASLLAWIGQSLH